MSKHTAIIRWKNNGPDFLNRRYSREHTLHFDGGAVVAGSPSPHIVPAPPACIISPMNSASSRIRSNRRESGIAELT